MEVIRWIFFKSVVDIFFLLILLICWIFFNKCIGRCKWSISITYAINLTIVCLSTTILLYAIETTVIFHITTRSIKLNYTWRRNFRGHHLCLLWMITILITWIINCVTSTRFFSSTTFGLRNSWMMSILSYFLSINVITWIIIWVLTIAFILLSSKTIIYDIYGVGSF